MSIRTAVAATESWQTILSDIVT